MQTVWFVRHGNREDFVDPEYRHTSDRPFDPPLSADGLAQARSTGRRLAGEGIARIYASPFLRTVQTANEIAAELDLTIRLEPGLSEWYNPHWFPERPELLPPDVLRRFYPRVEAGLESDVAPPFPETEQQVLGRSAETAERLARAAQAPILLVGHGISVGGGVLGLMKTLDSVDCRLCGLFKLSRNGGADWRLELNGCARHAGEAHHSCTIYNRF